MRAILVAALLLAACECEDLPETYGGGRQVGWWVDGDGRECATYRTLWCDYTVCQEARMCGYALTEWYCW